jgi:hypothetical protein
MEKGGENSGRSMRWITRRNSFKRRIDGCEVTYKCVSLISHVLKHIAMSVYVRLIRHNAAATHLSNTRLYVGNYILSSMVEVAVPDDCHLNIVNMPRLCSQTLKH